MAKFDSEIPYELMKEFEDLDKNAFKMMSEMCEHGAEVVLHAVRSNMKKSFKTTGTLEKGLKVSKVYRHADGETIATKVAFWGYDESAKPTKRHPHGKPIPLVANAREYGTSRGEKKKKYFYKSFNKKEIEAAMLEVQEKYLPKE